MQNIDRDPPEIRPTTPDDITAAAVRSFDGCADDRLRTILQSLTAHVHSFVKDVDLTEAEWRTAIDVLTSSGHITTDQRQEWILWSDVLAVSMLVDALAHPSPDQRTTESTILGPFYVPGAAPREYGAAMAEVPAGDPVWVHGRVLSTDGSPLAGAELDVWQNGDDELYAVQDPDAPEHHLRGRFTTRDDGTYGFVAVRPTPYPIPNDGPVGQMLRTVGRHPWRPAHVHMIVRAPEHRSLTTHIFDAESEYIDSDTVFAVKPSLLRSFVRRDPDDPGKPPSISGPWLSLESDFVLAPADQPGEPVDPGRTA